VKFRNLGVAVGLNLGPLVVEHFGQLLNCLALLRRNPGRVQFVLVASSATVRWPRIASSANLGLELSCKPSACPHGGSSSASTNPP
jgi:hypothetical protein